tara:strand:+ start:200 stop:496 length:297 start_codon:yes stop_codon:yes gene_type:complete
MIKIHYKKSENSWELTDKTFPTMNHAMAHAKAEGFSHYRIYKLTELANMAELPKKEPKLKAVAILKPKGKAHATPEAAIEALLEEEADWSDKLDKDQD